MNSLGCQMHYATSARVLKTHLPAAGIKQNLALTSQDLLSNSSIESQSYLRNADFSAEKFKMTQLMFTLELLPDLPWDHRK